jgi:hypothetical protein
LNNGTIDDHASNKASLPPHHTKPHPITQFSFTQNLSPYSLSIAQNLSQTFPIALNLDQTNPPARNLSQTIPITQNGSQTLPIAQKLPQTITIAQNLSSTLSTHKISTKKSVTTGRM